MQLFNFYRCKSCKETDTKYTTIDSMHVHSNITIFNESFHNCDAFTPVQGFGSFCGDRKAATKETVAHSQDHICAPYVSHGSCALTASDAA